MYKITINGTKHGAISTRQKGNDSQYCEAGETVKIKWQPEAGWGLQEAHYTPEGGDPVAIEDGEFIMPSANITIDATFKKFVIGDWTSGKDAAENAGKVLGFDENGNIVPVEGGGEEPTYENKRAVLFVGDDGKPTTANNFKFTSSSGGSLGVAVGDTMWGTALNVSKVSVDVGVELIVTKAASFSGTVDFADKATFYEGIQVGDKGTAKAIILFDTANPNTAYELKVTNGQIVVTQVQ